MKYLRYPESEAFAAQVRARVWNSTQLLIDLCIPCTARQRNAFGDAGRGAHEGRRGTWGIWIWIYIGDDSPFLSVVLILNVPSLGTQSCWWNKPTHACLPPYLFIGHAQATSQLLPRHYCLVVFVVGLFLSHPSQVVKRWLSFTETWFSFRRSHSAFHRFCRLHRASSSFITMSLS